MLNITMHRNDDALTVFLQGRLETATAPQLDAQLADALNGVTALTLDMEELEYLSSAGLRSLLKAQKCMQPQGTMKVIHANELIMEIFDVTGFTDILTIE